MLILAIDTALDACAAARARHRREQADRAGIAGDEARPCRSADAADRARDERGSGLTFAALDRIAVTTGPGSFTGLRVGLSAARGIALAADKPVVGVTTLTAYAAPIVGQNAEQPVISAIDARHDQVYFQVVGGDGSSLLRPRVAPIDGSARRRAVWRAASGRQRRQNPRRPLARRCAAAVQGRCPARARHCLGGMARRRGQSRYRAGAALLPARARRQAIQGHPLQTAAQPSAS